MAHRSIIEIRTTYIFFILKLMILSLGLSLVGEGLNDMLGDKEI